MEWWKERAFYQIYPRSFMDGNGDGIGDIKGIISKLDYLKWLGIGAVWLCPVYASPNADMGYDISDYEAIMEEFGSMEDFDLLLKEMHKRDIKLIMDLVVNHSSDEHRWFREARKRKDNPYRDFYIWREGKEGREPNNWSSFFTPSAWSYDETTGEWYLHLFSEKQPDLNWENPSLRKEIFAMINRWLDRGVDGFRMDVISLIAKDQTFPDAPGEGYQMDPTLFSFRLQMHQYLKEMRNTCFRGRDCMCVGETTFVNTTNAPLVVGDGTELDLLFQFDLMDIDGGISKWDLRDFDLARFKQIICRWQQAIPWNTLFWGNHDQPRAVSRFGDDTSFLLWNRSAKTLAAAMYLLKGTPFIYQGEEIGMTNYPFKSKDELRDVESLNLLKHATRDEKGKAWKGILAKGRDNARTPMQWNEENNAGFTTGTPWIAVNPNYMHINVEDEQSEEWSILSFYRQLLSLRASEKTILEGDFVLLLPEHPHIFAYERTTQDSRICVYCNLSGEEEKLELPEKGQILIKEAYEDGILQPWGCLITKQNAENSG
ncbi:MAG: alpha-glucosidase [Lachnospiraceae bacterium]|nr:alpha-glucosidase [Lachnospiraceae bacterium]